MNLIKNSDPLLLDQYLMSRINELKDLSVVKREDLLPTKLYQADKSCTYKKCSAGKTVSKFDQITEDFAILETQIHFQEKDSHLIPAIAFRAGDFSESILFIDGKEITGIANAEWDDGEPVFLQDLTAGDHTIGIHIETDTSYGEMRKKERTIMTDFSFLLIDKRIYDLYNHLSILLDLYNSINEREVAKHYLRQNLIKLYSLININDYKSIIKEYPNIAQFIQTVFYDYKNINPITLHMMGHAHLDIAWLWDIDKTKRKVIRTFLNQLNLIKKYPEMIFQMGQPWIYNYLKENKPDVYRQIKEYVKKGNIEPSGGIWVESDINVTGLESLIRQILHGKKFIQNEFNIDCKVLWMPDVFGFTGALPQILKKSGIDTIITTKISWNQHTRFPHDTFRWFSPDGSNVLCHFITLPWETRKFHTYNGKVLLPEIYASWDEYLNKDINQDLLIPYGYGDGGSGPKERMLDKIEIYRKNLPGFYNFKYTGIEGYRKILRHNLENKEIPTWHRDLYLQLHRGTYSSQSNAKKYNALLEHLLKSYEKLLVMFKKDDEELNDMWEEYLVQQFHDILPGTSINKVYQDAMDFYLALEKKLTDKMNSLISENPAHETNHTVFNPHGNNFSGAVKYNEQYYFIKDLPPLSLTEANFKQSDLKEQSGNTLENESLKVTIEPKDGTIASLYDKVNNIEYADGFINRLTTFEDRPVTPHKSAWLLEAYHKIKPLQKGLKVTSSQVYVCDDYQKCVVNGFIHNSAAKLEIILFRDSNIIYFDLDIDWCETNTVLKVENKLNLITDYVTYASQGCVIQKPNYYDTLDVKAQFENPAQRWVDMSETSYGVTLMSDYKYSFSADNNKLSMILLRSTVSPDKTADRGKHQIRYALFPHDKGWIEADIPNVAKSFYEPPLVMNGKINEAFQFVDIEDDNRIPNSFILESIKKSFDQKDIIVRGFEAKGSSGKILLKFNSLKIKKCFLCNLMEEELKEIPVKDNSQIEIGYKPFEIITVKITKE